VASASAWAQPARPTATLTVEDAQTHLRGAEQKLARLTQERAQLRRHYDEQLGAIDRLKKQKASWRRDRELNKAQADANDTAKRLTASDASIRLAQQELARARNAAIAAIDAELAAGGSQLRAVQLGKLRAQLAGPAPAPKKIVIPDAEIDPLADPEELERQAAAIAAAEQQLEAQRKGLDAQQKELARVAELLSAHERAGELSTRDDDQPHRGAQHSSRGNEAATAGSPSGDAGGGAGSGAGGGGGGGDTFGGDKLGTQATFESSAIALGEVIDKTTIEGMLRASRSGDPKQRAEAARQARDAVAKRLEQLRKKRAMIEARAKQLRGN
jgi:DNA repair exonuclease SbcCD ATPase subunit